MRDALMTVRAMDLQLRRESALRAPVMPQALTYERGGQSQLLTPLLKRLPLSVPVDLNIRATIIRLLAARGPRAVLRRVRAVIVDAFQGVFGGGTPADIAQKCLKRLSPLLAYRDATAPIVTEVCGVAIQAARLDRLPRFVLGRLRLSIRRVTLKMLRSHRRGMFTGGAAAGRGISACHGIEILHCLHAAVAATAHIGLGLLRGGFADHREAMKALTDGRWRPFHLSNYMGNVTLTRVRQDA